MLWRIFAKPLLFCLPAEKAHHLSMSLFHQSMFRPVAALTRRWFDVRDARLESDVFGIRFNNPVGLAAGFDKQATWFNALSNLGFSHIEVGTITGQAQPGNPAPRLFRLPADRALLNRMGFNNVGASQAAESLTEQTIRPVLGINIGKTKVVPNDQASDDYLTSFRALWSFAHYVTINVSSPNTPGLRELQERQPLLDLLTQLVDANQCLACETGGQPKPILLKIAPDLTEPQLGDVVSIVKETKISGLIATNTTISRQGLKTPQEEIERIGNGGLSGGPLTLPSRSVVKYLYRRLEGTTPIIGVGGIMNGSDAWEMLCAGASLVQVYTGFIYGGPSFVRSINRYLCRRMAKEGISNIQEIVGSQANV